jgi:hypothetical protein
MRLDQYIRPGDQGKAPDLPPPTRAPAQHRVLYCDAGEWVPAHVIRHAAARSDHGLLLAVIPQHGPIFSAIAAAGEGPGCWKPSPPMWADEGERQIGCAAPEPVRRPSSTAMRLVSARERKSARRVRDALDRLGRSS